MAGTAFEGKRVVRAYRQMIEAPPDVVFALLCPARETEWLDGWSYEMIYSASGLAEDGAVFRTSSPGEEDTVWVVTRHDRAAGQVQFTRFTPDSRTCVLRIAVHACGESSSHVDVSYAVTSIGRHGDAFLDGWTEERFREFMMFWERSMNHYVKTGRRLSRAAD